MHVPVMATASPANPAMRRLRVVKLPASFVYYRRIRSKVLRSQSVADEL
jgi:hypothetical protein